MNCLRICFIALALTFGADCAPVQAGDFAKKVDLVIVAPKKWQNALSDYAQKRKAALSIEVAALEDILVVTPGVDEAEKIKRYLFNQWSTNGLRYALLVGDCNVFPVRYMVLDRVTPAAFDYAFYPSDLYYADLAKPDGTFENWNGQQDDFHVQYFGEVRGEKNKNDPMNFDGIDYRAEIAVGRWPVQNDKDLTTIIDKSLAYELAVIDQKHAGLKSAALFSVGGWVDSRGSCDAMRKSLADWNVSRRYYSGDGRNDGTEAPNAFELGSLLKQGAALVLHAGHGEPSGWHACIGSNDFENIETRGKWPVVLSAGCSTAVFTPQAPYEAYLDMLGQEHEGTNAGETFDAPPAPPACLQSEKFNPSSMGERLLCKTENGAVIYIGCTTGSQPCALTLLEGFAAAVGVKKVDPQLDLRIGDAWTASIKHYYATENLDSLKPTESWYPASIFFQGMKFALFGDPSLPMAK